MNLSTCQIQPGGVRWYQSGNLTSRMLKPCAAGQSKWFTENQRYDLWGIISAEIFEDGIHTPARIVIPFVIVRMLYWFVARLETSTDSQDENHAQSSCKQTDLALQKELLLARDHILLLAVEPRIVLPRQGHHVRLMRGREMWMIQWAMWGELSKPKVKLFARYLSKME